MAITHVVAANDSGGAQARPVEEPREKTQDRREGAGKNAGSPGRSGEKTQDRSGRSGEKTQDRSGKGPNGRRLGGAGIATKSRQAGLVLGPKALVPEARVLGVDTAGGGRKVEGAHVFAIAGETAAATGLEGASAPGDVVVLDGHAGEGYGRLWGNERLSPHEDAD